MSNATNVPKAATYKKHPHTMAKIWLEINFTSALTVEGDTNEPVKERKEKNNMFGGKHSRGQRGVVGGWWGEILMNSLA